MQIVNKYMDNKSILLSLKDEKVDYDFPFNEALAFSITTESESCNKTYQDDSKDVIVYIDDINGIIPSLEHILNNMVWNFDSRHMILIKRTTRMSSIRNLVTKVHWKGYLPYNILIGFYDESGTLHFFTWFPKRSNQNRDRKNLEYLCPCNDIDDEEDPFVMGIFDKLSKYPLKLSIDVAATGLTIHLNTRVIDTFIKWEGIAGW